MTNDAVVHELGEGVSLVTNEDGSVAIIGPASSGDIECVEIPRAVVEPLVGKLFAANMSYAMRGWDKAMQELAHRLAALGRLSRLSIRHEQDRS